MYKSYSQKNQGAVEINCNGPLTINGMQLSLEGSYDTFLLVNNNGHPICITNCVFTGLPNIYTKMINDNV